MRNDVVIIPEGMTTPHIVINKNNSSYTLINSLQHQYAIYQEEPEEDWIYIATGITGNIQLPIGKCIIGKSFTIAEG